MNLQTTFLFISTTNQIERYEMIIENSPIVAHNLECQENVI